MVKVVHGGPAPGPDIITARDFLPQAPGVALAPVQGAPPTALAGAQNAVNEIDKWINIADKGITMLGRVDSILSRVQGIQGQRGQVQQPPPARESAVIMPDIPARINSDPVQPPAEPIAAAVQVAQGPAAPPAIDVESLIQIMTVIDNLQPGVSVAELRDAIARNPDQVSRLLAAYGGVKK